MEPTCTDARQRVRTFTGCTTCRKRHVKCDDSRPICGPCQRSRLKCAGYWSPLLWIMEGVGTSKRQQQGHGAGYRFPVQTGKEYL